MVTFPVTPVPSMFSRRTIGAKTLETNINITRTFGDDGICPSGSCIRNGVIAFKGIPIITLIAV